MIVLTLAMFLSDPGIAGVRSMGLEISNKLNPRPCADLTDVTLADEVTNSTPTDTASKAIQGLVAMQVTQPS